VNRIKTTVGFVKKQQRGDRVPRRNPIPGVAASLRKALAECSFFPLNQSTAKQVLDSRFKLSARHAIRATEEPKFPPQKIAVKAEPLRNVSELVRTFGDLARYPPLDRGMAAVGCRQAAQHSNRGCLAGAIWTEKTKDRADLI